MTQNGKWTNGNYDPDGNVKFQTHQERMIKTKMEYGMAKKIESLANEKQVKKDKKYNRIRKGKTYDI